MWFLILLALSIGGSLGFSLGCWWGAIRFGRLTSRQIQRARVRDSYDDARPRGSC